MKCSVSTRCIPCRLQGNRPRRRASRSLPQGGLAGGLELVARSPARHVVGVGDADADRESQARVLDHAVEVPVGPDLVARLVIVMVLVGLDLFAAPGVRAIDELGAGVEVEARDADAREAELIGAVEGAAIGE